MNAHIVMPKEELASFCRRWQIVELAIFGSALRNETAVEGLFLVGADTAGRGVGTEMAADSALVLWRTLRDRARAVGKQEG